VGAAAVLTVDAARPALAADPAIPSRDDLLDPATAAAVLGVEACSLVRAKYRIGESLRVVHRVAGGGLVAARAFPGGRVDQWTFPDDRKLRGVEDLLRPPAGVAALAGPGREWVASEVVEYAPERSVTVRAADAVGATVAYAKAYAPGTMDVAGLAARYDAVAAGLAATGLPVASPRALGWSAQRDLLVLEAMPGERWGDVAGDRSGALRRLGQAVAAVHGLGAVPDLRPFGRLAVPRVVHSAELVATARPDLAGPLADLTAALAGGPPADPRGPVVLHGDCHPKNALVDGDRLALVDLDQAGTGPAAADVGSLLARLRLGVVTGDLAGAEADRLAAAFLAGYRDVAEMPPPGSLRWHTAAALLAEQAMRAVNRVRHRTLLVLDRVVDAAADTLVNGALP
jgi:aminoglycoside phosphotransferase (APT) family kinase protein